MKEKKKKKKSKKNKKRDSDSSDSEDDEKKKEKLKKVKTSLCYRLYAEIELIFLCLVWHFSVTDLQLVSSS